MFELTYEADSGFTNAQWSVLTSNRQLFYVTAWKAFFLSGKPYYGRFKMFHDGTVKDVADPPINSKPGNFLSTMSGDLVTAVAVTYTSNAYYLTHPVTWTPNYRAVLIKGLPVATATPSAYRPSMVLDVVKKIFVRSSYTTLRGYSYTDYTGTLLYSKVLATSGDYSYVSAAENGMVCVAEAIGGRVKFVRIIDGEIIVEGRVDPFFTFCYDRDTATMVTLGSDRKIRVYIRTAWPRNLSQPEVWY